MRSEPAVAPPGPKGALDFDEFYVAEATAQVRRAALLTGSDELANDIVHSVLTAMYQRWDTIAEHGPYLNRAVLNGCRDAGRRRRTRLRLVQRLGSDQVEPVDRDYLTDALSQLPFNQRAAVVLRFYAGYSTADIADALGCPIGSVGPWISRALDTLRKDLR